MNERRIVLARWLRLRAGLRVAQAKLVAAQHALARDARRNDDTDLAVLAGQVAAQRDTFDALATVLDLRIADAASDCAHGERIEATAIIAAAAFGNAVGPARELRVP